jgi:hypothetical protein
MPIRPLICIGKNAMLKPVNISQNVHRPSRSDKARRLNAGVQ